VSVSKYNTDVIKYGDPQNTPPGGGGLAASVKTANYTITEDEDVGVDSSGGAFTITLKATPSVGDVAIVRDVGQSCGTNNVAIARNGSTINGVAADENLDVDNAVYMFIYNGSTWKFTPIVNGGLNEAEVIDLTSGLVTLQFLPYDFRATVGETTRVQAGGTYDSSPEGLSFVGTDGYHWAYVMWVPPVSWDGGQIRFREHFIGSTNNVGTVIFQHYATAVADGAAMPAYGTNYVTTTKTTHGSVDYVHVSPWSSYFTIDGSPTSNTPVFIRLQRAATDDTYTGSAELLVMEMQYTTDTPTDD